MATCFFNALYKVGSACQTEIGDANIARLTFKCSSTGKEVPVCVCVCHSKNSSCRDFDFLFVRTRSVKPQASRTLRL